jgi:hypothetical protein
VTKNGLDLTRLLNISNATKARSQSLVSLNVVVPYLALTSKFIVHVPGLGGYARRAQGLYWFG